MSVNTPEDITVMIGNGGNQIDSNISSVLRFRRCFKPARVLLYSGTPYAKETVNNNLRNVGRVPSK